MRLVSLLAILILSVSCGKNGGSGSSSGVSSGGCNLNGRAVACESIRGADGLGVDLLESMVDVPIQVTDSSITFMADRSSSEQGRRIECPTVVRNGEVYSYSLNGDILMITTESGQRYEMHRLNDSQGLMGAWAWKGYVDQGTHMIRQLSFLSQSRVIMRTSCEL